MRPLMLILLLLLTAPALAAPDAELWPRWVPSEGEPQMKADHGLWQEFLVRNVRPGSDEIARVAYRGITAADRQALQDYLSRMAALTPSKMAPAQAKAYWINLYNALTVQVVLAHLPVESIRDIDISPGLFSNGPWGAELIRVEGIGLTLDDIEHRILRPIWRDARIHYAVNCASLGCPDLRGEAFVPERLDAQLDDAARRFIAHERAVRVEDGALILSSIYDWFADDFGRSERDVIQHIRQFAPPELAGRLVTFHGVDRYQYDWRLNGFSSGR